MYQLFESLLQKINDFGHERFTSYYLLFQVLLFVALLAWQTYKIVLESVVLKQAKAILVGVSKAHGIEKVEADLQSFFVRQKVNSKYKMLWNRYYERIIERQGNEQIKIEPFFGYDVMYHFMAQRSLMDIGGTLFITLGILNTFIGLSVGMANLSLGDADAMRVGITTLLGGMKTAFYASALGVVLSLLWMFFDRILSSTIESSIDWHSERLDFLLSADDEEVFLNRLESLTRNQTEQMNKVLSDVFTKTMQPITTSFGAMQTSMESQAKMMEQQMEMSKTTGADMTKQLIDQVTGGTEQSISLLTTLINDSQGLQKAMMSTMDKVVSSFSDTEQRQTSMIKQTDNMMGHFDNIVREMNTMQNTYNDASTYMVDLGSSFKQMQHLALEQLPVQQQVMQSNISLASKYENVVESFASFQGDVEKKYEQLLNQLVTVSLTLSDSFKDMSSNFTRTLSTQQMTLTESETLLKLIGQSTETISPFANDFHNLLVTIKTLQEQIIMMEKTQAELLPELIGLREDTTKTTLATLDTTKSYMGDMKDQMDIMRENWTDTKEIFGSTTKALNSSMKEFADNVDAGLTKTYHHFDETLKLAVSNVTDLIEQFSDIQADFIEEVGNITDTMRKANRSRL